MSDLNRGDKVALSRAQTSRVDVLTPPAIPNEPYTITLPINESPVAFTYLGQVGESADEVAAGLEIILLRDQTPFFIAIGPVASALAIVGDLGQAFTPTVSSNLSTSIFEEAVASLDGLGNVIGPLRVIDAESSQEKIREFTTRDRDGNLETIEEVRLRELDSSNVFDVRRTEILTVIEQGGTPT